MKNEELFNRSVDVLVKAYQNDTLVNGSCYACAVGNLVAAAKNDRVLIADKDFVRHSPNGYSDIIYKGCPYWESLVSPDWGMAVMLANRETGQSMATGYTPLELKQIEAAFEGRGLEAEDVEEETSKDATIFAGLIRVYDVLCDIHEVEKDTQPTGAEVFSKEKVVELI